MMIPSKKVVEKAEAIIDDKKVIPTIINLARNTYSFIVDDKVLVSYNHKGWLCDSKESDESYNKRVATAKNNHSKVPDRWSCSFNSGKYHCCHTYACRLLLERLGILVDSGVRPSGEEGDT